MPQTMMAFLTCNEAQPPCILHDIVLPVRQAEHYNSHCYADDSTSNQHESQKPLWLNIRRSKTLHLAVVDGQTSLQQSNVRVAFKTQIKFISKLNKWTIFR